VRLTWQASSKNRIAYNETFENFCLCFARVDLNSQAPEAANNNHNRRVWLTQVTWNSTATNKLLFQAGYTAALAPGRVNDHAPGTSDQDIPITEQSTGYNYNAFQGFGSTSYGKPIYNQVNGRASVSYITGSHALKGGWNWQWNNMEADVQLDSPAGIGPVAYTFRKPSPDALPLPVSITEYASPQHAITRSWVHGLYAQDQWTMNRVTLNLGVRFDQTRGYIPAQTRPAGVFTPAVPIPYLNDVPNFKDITPRLGAAYDVFGNGKSAIKFSIGKYTNADHLTTAAALNPANAIVTSANRNWNDLTFPVGDPRRGNYVPDCDLTSVSANGECAALSNNGFGSIRIASTYDPNQVTGWGIRPYSWVSALTLQQELRPGMAAMIGYFHTSYGNFKAVENQAVSPSDFDTFCINVPNDPRVPSLNGSKVCGFHDINPLAFGKSQLYNTSADKFGGQSEVFNGIDIGVNARYGKGGLLTGGVSTGETVYDNCAISINYPNVNTSTAPSDFCHYSTSWSAQTQYKVGVSYPLPWYNLQTSLTYQNLPGLIFNTTYVASNAEISQSLGRNLGSCGTAPTCTTTVSLTNALYSPNSEQESRFNQLDLRFTKIFTSGQKRLKGNFDIYNIFNTATILSEGVTYSPTNTYLRPQSILGARMFKFGVDIDF
jgi:hypothetical protein